jgi:thiol-disulfide isomerase/thioredoxin
MKVIFTKIILLLAIITGMSISAQAKAGFKINVRFTDAKDSLIYLCHYYGKGSTVYKDDSARLSKNGEAKFKCDTAITGGIYLFYFADKSASMEFILKNGDDFSMEVAKGNIYQSAQFKGTTENNLFYDYQRYLMGYSKEFQKIEAELATCKNKKDSTDVYDKIRVKSKELNVYRREFNAKNPTTLMSKIFNAVEEPEIPTELPTLPDGKKDSLYPRNYFKKHFWDKFDQQDDRLIITPLYERKLDDYMNRLVVPVSDSVIAACNELIAKTKGTKEMYKFTLHHLTYWTETSKIMGMDAAFVYLVENYYMKGLAPWADSTYLNKLIDRAKKISPNMIGNNALDIRCTDSNYNVKPLSSINAKYTVLIFWSPSCGHCEKEIPQFDSLYRAALKKYGVQFYAVMAENDELQKWKDFIKKNDLIDGWNHVLDPQNKTNFRGFYDVYSTPTIYLLDENKIIRGKRIDHTNILGLIEWLEKNKGKIDNKNKIIK